MEEQLIEFVRKHNCLYDKSNPQYKIIPLRDKKFEELSKKLNIPASKLKARWRTLRDTFHKEIKAESFDCTSSTKKQWKWMEHLRFLQNVNHSNSSTPIPARFSGRKRRFANITGEEDTSRDDLTLLGDNSETNFTDERTSTMSIAESDSKTKFEQTINESRIPMLFIPPTTAITPTMTNGNGTSIVHYDASTNTRSAVQLFFESLAKQTEDANISARKFAQLQLKLLQVFNKEIYDI
ncbi:uncharacterized protein LOC129951659 [Eupeodes corollae]|uniref:uncharacterized protein LOC129951659 n=1 Tax=Eupeodes corollae TaxID=290404 RepID=UPI002491F198|nr:uncharacterized protein LOC129951659 [Eupeodes corollae]